MTAVHGEPRPRNLVQGWTVDDSTFGARLALVRQRMQWNIKEAARECGIPAASWGTWEGGAMPRRYTEMCRLISNRVGCDYGWLLDGPGLTGAASIKTVFPTLTIPAASDAERPTQVGPFSGGRRDSVRPTSAVPATKRRPARTRSSNRPTSR